MNQTDFNKLLEKYLDGSCSPDEEIQVSEWAEKQNQKEMTELSDIEKHETEKRIWSNIKSKTFTGKQVLSRAPQYFRLFGYGVAASVALFALLFWYQQSSSKSFLGTEQLVSKTDVEIKNTSDKRQDVHLEDGSLVILEPQSTLAYHGHFGDKVRRVYLQGTAFFNIKRDSTKPFLVHINNITTEVLGTSFKITTNEKNKDVEVAVLTGKVLVYENQKSEAHNKRSVLLTPNQKVRYTQSDAQLTPEIVESPVLIGTKPAKPDLIFEDAPLTQVIDSLKRMYNLEIIIANNDLKKCLLTADLNDLTMPTQLDLVCKSINAHYETRGIYIFIEGKGCVD
jgi:transmembrane sensor